MATIQTWGRLSNTEHDIISFQTPNQAIQQLKQHLPGVAYGMGRSYGDVALNTQGNLWHTTTLNHLISFVVPCSLIFSISVSSNPV